MEDFYDVGRWRELEIYRCCRYEKDESGGEPSYHVRGFITVYMYYAYPEHYRPRIRWVNHLALILTIA